MVEAGGTMLLLALCGGAFSTLAIEQGLRPAPSLKDRPWRAWGAHFGVWILAFAVVLAVTARPFFSALLVLAELGFIVLVSNAKRNSLREPFVFADLEYFIDALRHPRLFMPYFTVWGAVLTAVVFGLVLFLGLALEPSLRDSAGYSGFAAIIAALAVSASLLLWLGRTGSLPVNFDADADLKRCGLLACFWFYAIAERRPFDASHVSPFKAVRSSGASAALPHVVIVQSESYFDARRLYPEIRPEVYARFDAIKRQSVQHGTLIVPAWGGNTTRSEFSFLSGLTDADIGVHRFNPHRRLARRPMPSVASVYRQAGYRTACIHPYPVQFNSRDVVYPALGFDQFIDVTAFDGADRFGPYISDEAVTRQICAMLREAREPTLLFVITMENHGPLHLESPAPGDVERLYVNPPPPGFDDFSVYLRHVANADRMIAVIQDVLENNPRDGVFCWYGDHVPILPRVYRDAGFEDGRTDYFIWRKGGGAPLNLDVRVESLGGTVLQQSGFSIQEKFIK